MTQKRWLTYALLKSNSAEFEAKIRHGNINAFSFMTNINLGFGICEWSCRDAFSTIFHFERVFFFKDFSRSKISALETFHTGFTQFNLDIITLCQVIIKARLHFSTLSWPYLGSGDSASDQQHD